MRRRSNSWGYDERMFGRQNECTTIKIKIEKCYNFVGIREMIPAYCEYEGR
jgi:hypothetical protein